MNYIEWSQEYYSTADKLLEVIDRLKSERAGLCKFDRVEIDKKIAEYRSIRYDCINIAELLMRRHRGAA